MTLYDYISNYPDPDMWEFAVIDNVYDVETYFYDSILHPDDDWDKAMATIAKKLTVIRELPSTESGYDYDKVIVNLSEVIEKALPYTKELFIDNEIDPIMDDIENILSGCVSERWLMDFAKVL